MKRLLYRVLPFAICIFAGCNGNEGAVKSGKIDSLSDDQIKNAISKKMASISFGQELPTGNIEGYKMPQEYINAAPFLVGKLVNIENGASGATLTLVSDFNYLISPEKVSNNIVNNLPFFDTYINKSVAANLSAISAIKAGMGDSDSYHISYQTVLSSVAIGNFIDYNRLAADAKKWNFNQYKNPQVVFSVMLNRLSYTKFTKISGNFSGVSSLVSLDGSIYGQSGSQINSYELYVTTVVIPALSNSKLDSVALGKILPSGTGLIQQVTAVRKESPAAISIKKIF